jgi:hypothetical protein
MRRLFELCAFGKTIETTRLGDERPALARLLLSSA